MTVHHHGEYLHYLYETIDDLLSSPTVPVETDCDVIVYPYLEYLFETDDGGIVCPYPEYQSEIDDDVILCPYPEYLYETDDDVLRLCSIRNCSWPPIVPMKMPPMCQTAWRLFGTSNTRKILQNTSSIARSDTTSSLTRDSGMRLW